MNVVDRQDDMVPAVVIYSAANSQQAHLLKFALAERGIVAEVANDALQVAAGGLPFGLDISPRVVVRPADAEQARKLALEFDQDLSKRLLRASGERHRFPSLWQPLKWIGRGRARRSLSAGQYSIYGLLILTTCAAVYFGLVRAAARLSDALPGSITFAAIYILLGFAMWRAYRRRKLEQSQWDDADDER
jgi:hypothetical protein